MVKLRDAIREIENETRGRVVAYTTTDRECSMDLLIDEQYVMTGVSYGAVVAEAFGKGARIVSVEVKRDDLFNCRVARYHVSVPEGIDLSSGTPAPAPAKGAGHPVIAEVLKAAEWLRQQNRTPLRAYALAETTLLHAFGSRFGGKIRDISFCPGADDWSIECAEIPKVLRRDDWLAHKASHSSAVDGVDGGTAEVVLNSEQTEALNDALKRSYAGRFELAPREGNADEVLREAIAEARRIMLKVYAAKLLRSQVAAGGVDCEETRAAAFRVVCEHAAIAKRLQRDLDMVRTLGPDFAKRDSDWWTDGGDDDVDRRW